MISQELILPVATALGGIVLGAFLKPIVDGWFEKRRKSLLYIQDPDHAVFRPHDGRLTLHWDDDLIDEVVQVPFEVWNKSGRTLRNFTLEIRPVVTEGQFFQLSIEDQVGASYDRQSAPFHEEISFKAIEPNIRLKGQIVASCVPDIQVVAIGDVELSRSVVKDQSLGPALVSVGISLISLALAFLAAQLA